jgi:hypothetical protein
MGHKTPAAPDDVNPAVVFEKRPIYGDWRLISLEVQATARKSQRREAHSFTPQRLRDAAQRRNWPFYGTVKFGLIRFGGSVILKI